MLIGGRHGLGDDVYGETFSERCRRVDREQQEYARQDERRAREYQAYLDERKRRQQEAEREDEDKYQRYLKAQAVVPAWWPVGQSPLWVPLYGKVVPHGNREIPDGAMGIKSAKYHQPHEWPSASVWPVSMMDSVEYQWVTYDEHGKSVPWLKFGAMTFDDGRSDRITRVATRNTVEEAILFCVESMNERGVMDEWARIIGEWNKNGDGMMRYLSQRSAYHPYRSEDD